MYKLLIPLVAVLFGTATYLHAQVPVSISIAAPLKTHQAASGDAPELVCNNFAGTFVLGQTGVNTQSNDLTLDTLFLCFGDSIFVNHNGDAVLTGDPIPASTPGVGWAFYDCPPSVMGDSLKNIVADSCIVLSAITGRPVLAVGNPEGDLWFFNSGFLQATYNSGKPVLFHFAPITIDNFGVPPTYESPQVGAPPGPCVNVNTAVEFSVVYLNAITATGITTNFNNDCLGKFRVRGGFPEWDPSARYTINISLAGDPSVKGLIHTSANQFFHSADIIFSVPQPGTYDITIEDGKSCGHTFQMNMGSCMPVDNVVLTLPELEALPGSQICVPLTVENFSQIVSTNFSLQWDPSILQYTGVQNYAIPAMSLPPDVLNAQMAAQGQLGVALNTTNGSPFSVANGGTLFEVCFTIIGQLGECSPIAITNTPTQIGIENQTGNQQAITADSGQVCVNFSPLTSVVEFIDTTCLATATLKVTATGGQPPYDVTVQTVGGPVTAGSISISGGMYAIPGEQNGTYIVRVVDDNGFGQELIDTITLNLTTLGVALDLTKLPTCYGSADGVITANVFVGSTPAPDPSVFTYTWKPDSISQNNSSIDSLPAGTYYVTVTNAKGCKAFASGTLGQPPVLIQQMVTVTDAACTGVEDGAISLTVGGGTPFPGMKYNFEWNYSPTDTGVAGNVANQMGTSSMLTQLAAGFYYVTVTDANGCTFVPAEPLEVENIRTIEIVITDQVNATCFGAMNGSVSIEVISTPPFTNPMFFFIWPDTTGTETNTNTTSTLTDLPAGIYGVLAAETSGCGDTAFVTITEPTRFVLDTAALMNPTCTNMNDGLIRVGGSGGTGLGNTFTYMWSGGLSGNQEQPNLTAGTYSVTASDANGCSDSLTFVLMLPPPPIITQVDSTSVKCGSDGCLTVTAPTATSFIWQNMAGTTVATTAAACNLPGGTYTVEIRDVNNCVTQDTFSLDSVDVLFFSDTTLTRPTCFGDSNGTISVGVMGGNTPYTFLWTPTGQTNSTLIQAKAGSYVLQVTDANACVLADTFSLLDAPRIDQVLIDSSYQAASCADSCNGRAALEVHYTFDGSVMSGDFDFLWDDGSTDSLRVDLCAGIHSVTITDGNNCFTIGTIDIQSPDSVTATLTTIPVTCFNGSDGSAMATAAGGNGAPFQYAWNNSDSTATVTDLSAGIYAVTVSDKNGCQAVFSAEVTQPDSITLTPTIGEITCFGQSDGDLSVKVAGGNPGVFTYSWSDGTNLVGTTNPLEMLAGGTYSVTATDAKGCTGMLGNIVLPDAVPVQGAYETLDTLQCNGDETTLNIDTIFGGAGGPYQYSLDFGVTLNPNFPINIGGGEHFITYFDRLNCEFTDTITVPEPAPITVTFDPAVIEIELGDSTQLQPIISGADQSTLTYVWTPAEFLLNLPSLTPTVYSFESQAFTLVVTDQKGCVGTGSVVVDVDPNRNVYLPNVFMPGNPRGLNDHFNPLIGRGVEMINYMRIYDRWGSLMYERTAFVPDGDNFSEGWDGKYGGQYVNPGVYVYVVEARFLDDKILLYRGDVTVVR